MRFHTMTPNDFKIVAENIDDFIEVPDGIGRLRKAVLTLAVAGKLVVQDKKEGTAQDLYIEIQTERSARKKEAKEFALVRKEEVPFEIPKSWKWVRMGDVGDFGGGSGFPKEYQTKVSGNVPFFKVSDMNRNVREMRQSENWITEEIAKKIKAKILPPNTIIFPKIGGAIATNKRRLLVVPSCIDNNCLGYVPNPKILGDWMFLHLTNIDLAKFQVGSSIPALNIGTLDQILVSLPPLAEQKRIVKKVEAVMKQLDELETKKLERDKVRALLARSAMQSLGRGDSKVAFEHLAELVKTPADLKEFEGALLTLAVSGKLVPQDKMDGTAEELYAKIKSERMSTIRKRKSQELQQPTSVETGFDIPKSWKWIRLGDCMDISSGDSIKVSEATEGKYLVYGGNGIAGRHTASNASKGTIVIGRVGALCGIAHITETDAWVTDNAFIVSYSEKFLDRDFFALLLNQLNLRKSHRGSAQPVISGISVYPIPMPLPPLAEQKRIVKKVEEVMVLINRLKQTI